MTDVPSPPAHDADRMFTIALRNLQWRRRRIVIAAVGAGLVISLALVMAGLSAGFDDEAARTVGRVSGARLLAGVPNVYVSLTDAREMTFGGQQLATAVVVDRPYAPIAGTRSLTNAEAIRDGLRPVDNAERTIAMVRTLLWIVAGLIVGSVITSACWNAPGRSPC